MQSVQWALDAEWVTSHFLSLFGLSWQKSVWWYIAWFALFVCDWIEFQDNSELIKAHAVICRAAKQPEVESVNQFYLFFFFFIFRLMFIAKKNVTNTYKITNIISPLELLITGRNKDSDLSMCRLQIYVIFPDRRKYLYTPYRKWNSLEVKDIFLGFVLFWWRISTISRRNCD